MPEEQMTIRKRILHAAQELIAEKEIGAVSSRDIARRAGVGLGSINYHYESRDDLLAQAVLACFRSAAEGYRAVNEPADPETALVRQIFGMLRLLLQFGETGRLALRHKLTRRTFSAERHMLKFISLHYGDGLSPLELKLKSLQLSATVAMAFFNREEFFRYADIDLCDMQETERFVQALVGSVLKKPNGGTKNEAQG